MPDAAVVGPRIVEDEVGVRVAGMRCVACGNPLAVAALRCPVCGGELVEERFGPGGQVWASTVVRIPVPGRTPPYGLAYVDLHGGPRVLAHTAGDRPAAVGSAVTLVGSPDGGDVLVEAA